MKWVTESQKSISFGKAKAYANSYVDQKMICLGFGFVGLKLKKIKMSKKFENLATNFPYAETVRV